MIRLGTQVKDLQQKMEISMKILHKRTFSIISRDSTREESERIMKIWKTSFGIYSVEQDLTLVKAKIKRNSNKLVP